ncbi:MAG: hypothetical protein K5768_04065 [Firmicutes bacterium]|nr:hypothetical protein [Bacillota bacterium]
MKINRQIGVMKTMKDYCTAREILILSGFKFHHTGNRRGYISRKIGGFIEEYEGKFGKGFALILPRYDTTNYVNVEYWIKEDDYE